MTIRRSLLTAALCLSVGAPAGAQSVGILQSAETIDEGVFKLTIAPILTFGKDGAEDELGVGARGGYGFSDRFDAEARLGFFEHGTYVGVDGEYWILKNETPNSGLAFSLTGGVHWLLGKKDRLDTMGLDLTPILSGHVSPAVELYGALDVSFESVKDAPAGADDTFTTLHLVPGIEYRLSATADLVGEFGIALNDESAHYVGLGIAFYFR